MPTRRIVIELLTVPDTADKLSAEEAIGVGFEFVGLEPGDSWRIVSDTPIEEVDHPDLPYLDVWWLVPAA
jgi:hypothetical protein